MYSYGPLHMAKQKQDDQLELTYSSYVKIQDVTLKTCQRRWTIGKSGERGSGISVLAAWHDDDDDDDDIYILVKIYIYIYTDEIHNIHTHPHTHLKQKTVFKCFFFHLWYSLGNLYVVISVWNLFEKKPHLS